jgi:hypothetical protein
MSTCGDAKCTLPRGHGGDFHVGEQRENGVHPMWPMKKKPVKPTCNCGSLYEWNGRIIHYAECAVIRNRLGH